MAIINLGNGVTFEGTPAECMEYQKLLGIGIPAPTAGKTGKGASQPKAEKVPYKKADGSTVMATPAQVAAWDKWKSRDHKTLDEVKAIKFSGFTTEMDEWIKAHPICTRKEFKAQFNAEGITKEQLREHKDALGVHKK